MSWAPGTGIVLPARAAAVMGIVWIAAYAPILHGQGSGVAPRPVFYAAFVGTMALFCAAGSTPRTPDRLARPILVAAATGYLSAGLLALMSIGLPLLAAAWLALGAALNRGLRDWSVVAAASMAVVVFLVGIRLT